MLAYGEQRDKELYDAYRRELARHTKANGNIDSMAAVEAAVLQPCSRFWISEEIAAENIRKFKSRPELLQKMIPTKRAMYEELIAVFDRLRADPDNDDLNDKQVAYLASDTEASQFYMTPGSAMVRICAERRKRVASNNSERIARKVMENVKDVLRKDRPAGDTAGTVDGPAGEATGTVVRKPQRVKDATILPKWTNAVFKPRPLNWHIKKRVRTAIQYVIRWES